MFKGRYNNPTNILRRGIYELLSLTLLSSDLGKHPFMKVSPPVIFEKVLIKKLLLAKRFTDLNELLFRRYNLIKTQKQDI